MGPTGQRATVGDRHPPYIRQAEGGRQAGSLSGGAERVKRPDPPLDTTAAPELRKLYIKHDGKIMVALVDKEPSLADVILQPREVASLVLFPVGLKNPDGRTPGSFVAEMRSMTRIRPSSRS